MARWRRLLCLVAAVLAGAAALLAANDKALTASPEFITGGLAALAIGALVLALWPSGPEWSTQRRAGTAFAAAAWIMLGGPVLLFTIAVAGCACAPGGPSYSPPAPLGIDARLWIVFALVSGPILLLVAAALPRHKGTEAAELR